jgi:hypothetical protein
MWNNEKKLSHWERLFYAPVFKTNNIGNSDMKHYIETGLKSWGLAPTPMAWRQ